MGGREGDGLCSRVGSNVDEQSITKLVYVIITSRKIGYKLSRGPVWVQSARGFRVGGVIYKLTGQPLKGACLGPFVLGSV